MDEYIKRDSFLDDTMRKYCNKCERRMKIDDSYTIPEAMAVLQCASEEAKRMKRDAKRMKRRWEDGFQRWSDEKQNDGTTEYGACGYGMICDFCSDEDMGRPCVRAWNAWLRENGLAANYAMQTFEDAWNGILT